MALLVNEATDISTKKPPGNNFDLAALEWRQKRAEL